MDALLVEYLLVVWVFICAFYLSNESENNYHEAVILTGVEVVCAKLMPIDLLPHTALHTRCAYCCLNVRLQHLQRVEGMEENVLLVDY